MLLIQKNVQRPRGWIEDEKVGGIETMTVLTPNQNGKRLMEVTSI